MAAKVILKDAKAPLHLLRGSVLSAIRPRTAPAVGELVQALGIATQKPISEAPVLRPHLFDEFSLKSQGFAGAGRIWAAGKPSGRGSNKVVDEVDDDDDDDEIDSDNIDGDEDSDDIIGDEDGDDLDSEDGDFCDDDDEDDYSAHYK